MRTISESIKFTCFNDCISVGCPDHTVQAVWEGSSDTVRFDFSDDDSEVYDPDRFRAMMKAFEALGDN